MYMKPLNSSEVAGGSRRRKNRNKNKNKNSMKRKNRSTKNFKKNRMNQMGGEHEGKETGIDILGKLKHKFEKMAK